MSNKIAILAGDGHLPKKLISACKAQGREVFVIGFEGQSNPDIVDFMTHVGAAGGIIERLHDEGVKEIVFAGGIKRPALKEIKPDLRGTKILAKIGLKALGDDALLKVVSSELEKEGFRIIGVHEILEEILAPEGTYTKVEPDEQALADIRHGREVARSLGLADVGQSVVVQQGLVLGVEAIEGTDALLDRCVGLKKEGLGGVLVKMKKPQQSMRFDLPTIGDVTVIKAHEAGLRGIAIRAGETIVIDREKMVAKADELGMFIVALDKK